MNNKSSIEIKELNDGSGDCYIEIPPDCLKKLDWKEDDDLRFIPQPNGTITIKRVKLESVELDFDDNELFKYMRLAHDRGQSFNELCENALENIITRSEFENECG
jgi:hypothetical protein